MNKEILLKGIFLAAMALPLSNCAKEEAKSTSYNYYMYIPNGQDSTLSAYSIDKSSGGLTAIAGSPYSVGTGPLQAVADKDGKYLYVANQSSKTITAFSIDKSSGALSTITGSPFAIDASTQSMVIDNTGKNLFVFMTGSVNAIGSLPITASTGALGSMTKTTLSNAIHGIVSSDGKYLYVLTSSGTIQTYSIGSGGTLTAGTSYTVSSGASHFAMDPTGTLLYVTRQTNSTVYIYTVNTTTGALTSAGSQSISLAHMLAMDPNGKFAYITNANGSSINTVSTYSITAGTGALTASTATAPSTGGVPFTAVDATGKFIYVTAYAAGSTALYGFSIDSSSGGLTAIAGSPYTVGRQPSLHTIAKVAQ